MGIEDEVWKDIPDFEGLYKASDRGRISSTDRIRTYVRNGVEMERFFEGTVLSQSLGVRGYPKVNLCNELGCVTRHVHVLIALAFHGPRPAGMDVCHNDGDKLNTKSSNLRYDTPSANFADRESHGTGTTGAGNPNAKLTDERVVAIRKDLETMMQKDVAAKYNVPVPTVGAIKQRRTWRHL